jgi:hypothetical protein
LSSNYQLLRRCRSGIMHRISRLVYEVHVGAFRMRIEAQVLSPQDKLWSVTAWISHLFERVLDHQQVMVHFQSTYE